MNVIQFINERVKVKPVTNAELDTVRDMIKKKQRVCAAAIREAPLRELISRENPKIEKFLFGTYVLFLLHYDEVDWLVSRIQEYDKSACWWVGYFNEDYNTFEEAKSKLIDLNNKFWNNGIPVGYVITKIAGTADIN